MYNLTLSLHGTTKRDYYTQNKYHQILKASSLRGHIFQEMKMEWYASAGIEPAHF
jgi:hypothetical protein